MIPDHKFIQSPDVPGPTKEEIRCLVMCKAQITPQDVIVDLGCGTGGLTLESARKGKMVYAVDHLPEAISLTNQNLHKHHLDAKAQVLEDDAMTALDDLPPFDVLLVGGSSGELTQIISKGYKKLKKGGRIVVTSILLETRVEAVSSMKKLGLMPDVVEVFIARGKILERGTMMKGGNPVTIISAVKSLG